MNIQTPPAQELQLFDNYGLWHVPFWHKPWFIVVAIIVGSFLVALVLFLFFKFKPIKKKKLSFWQQALHDLSKLEKSNLNIVAQSSAFYAALTAIIKNYMSERYNKDVRSFTDQQMVVYIDTLSLFDAQKQSLEQIFSAGELIKFANQDALEKQMYDDMQFSVKFVQTTKNNQYQGNELPR